MEWLMSPAALALCAQLGVGACNPFMLYPAAHKAGLYDYQLGCNITLGVCPTPSIVRNDECVFVGSYGHFYAFMCRRVRLVS